MCRFWSAILTRDGRVLWDPGMTSHGDIIEKFELEDIKLKDRDFCAHRDHPEGHIQQEKG